MKSLVDFINESVENTTVTDLFKKLDRILKDKEWDDALPIIEEIFKNRWGKAIKFDDKFTDKMEFNQDLVLGFNKKNKKFIVARYNNKYGSMSGLRYDGQGFCLNLEHEINWSSMAKKMAYDEDNLKLRFANGNNAECDVILSSLSDASYDGN